MGIMSQLMSALAFIHSRGIVHGDIKLDNILCKFPEFRLT